MNFIFSPRLSQADHPNEQGWQFILDSRAMRQQIKTGISRESEQSYRVTGHMTDSNIMQTLPQTALSLVQWLRLVAFGTETQENGQVSLTDVTMVILILNSVTAFTNCQPALKL